MRWWYTIIAFVLGAAGAALTAWWLSLRWARRRHARQRELLERTRRAEKLAEVGRLTSGLAHELRNPLSTIKMNLQLLAEDLARQLRDAAGADPAPASVSLEELRQTWQRYLRRIQCLTAEADRLADTLTDFLRYAGKMELHPVRADVNEIVDDLADFYEPQALSQGVRLRRSLHPQPLVCRVDTDLFKQALLNLFINATQAMNGRGELILRTGASGDEARIDVIDTGPGIPAELQQRIFDAYFTTRPGGTGLGLPTTRRIVEEHHGRLELHSEMGRGSNFVMVLPLLKDMDCPSGAGQPPPPLLSAGRPLVTLPGGDFRRKARPQQDGRQDRNPGRRR